MNKEELYELIEQYLNDELAGDDLQKFVARLQTDKSLAEEVELHRSLQMTMVDPVKNDLRVSLSDMREEFKNTEPEQDVILLKRKGMPRRILWIAAASILLLGLVWWSVSRKDAPVDRMVKDPEIEHPPIPEDGKEIDDKKDLKVIPNSNGQDEIVENDPSDKQSPEKDKPTIDFYKENNQLVALIEQAKKGKTHKFDFDDSGQNEKLNLQQGRVALNLKGDLVSYDFPDDGKLEFMVYNNQTNSFNNSTTAYSSAVDLEKKEGDFGFGGEEFSFGVKQTAKLAPGRYYYVIRLEGDSTVLTGGSFLVEK